MENTLAYWPKDTENTMYLVGETSLAELNCKIKEKWPDADLENIIISTMSVHNFCCGYDLFDASDYTILIRIEKLD